MKKRGHYCKVCGEYKANEKYSGKGHAAHICKTCAALPPEKQAEEMTVKVAAEAPEGTHPEALAIEAMRQCVLEALDYLGRLVQGEFAS